MTERKYTESEVQQISIAYSDIMLNGYLVQFGIEPMNAEAFRSNIMRGVERLERVASQELIEDLFPTGLKAVGKL